MLIHLSEGGSSTIYLIKLNKGGAGLASLGRSLWGRGLRMQKSRGEAVVDSVVDSLNIHTEPRGKPGHSPGTESLGSLTWLCPCQPYTLTRDSIQSPHRELVALLVTSEQDFPG